MTSLLHPQSTTVLPEPVSAPPPVARRTVREVERIRNEAMVSVHLAQAATAVALTGLEGADLLARQTVLMIEEHGPAITEMVARPVLEGFGNRVRCELRHFGRG